MDMDNPEALANLIINEIYPELNLPICTPSVYAFNSQKKQLKLSDKIDQDWIDVKIEEDVNECELV